MKPSITEDIFKAVNLLQNQRQKAVIKYVKFYQPRVKGNVKGKTKHKSLYICQTPLNEKELFPGGGRARP